MSPDRRALASLLFAAAATVLAWNAAPAAPAMSTGGAAAAATVAAPAEAAAQPAPDVRIAVGHQAEVYTVDARVLLAGVRGEVAWEVLTDFDRMAAFMPNLVESRVTSARGEELVVAQKGFARFGLLKHTFETVREVKLRPRESVFTRTIGGTLKRVESMTRLAETATGIRIDYHLEVVPGFWIPGFVTEFLIQRETRRQFDAVIHEMQRRQVARRQPAHAGPAK